MKSRFARLLPFLRPGVMSPLPPGMTADDSAMFGMMALWSNLNNFAQPPAVVTSASPTILNAAQVLSGCVLLNAGAGAGFVIQLPSTISLINQMGPTIPNNGTFALPITFVNGAGFTGTVTAGDASTTIVGTATIATVTVRRYMLTVLTATTIQLLNIGANAQ